MSNEDRVHEGVDECDKKHGNLRRDLRNDILLKLLMATLSVLLVVVATVAAMTKDNASTGEVRDLENRLRTVEQTQSSIKTSLEVLKSGQSEMRMEIREGFRSLAGKDTYSKGTP